MPYLRLKRGQLSLDPPNVEMQSGPWTKQQFRSRSGQIMEDSAIKLDKWLCAFWLIANAKNGISSYELHRAIGVTQKTAWFMLHRVRLAMQDDYRRN